MMPEGGISETASTFSMSQTMSMAPQGNIKCENTYRMAPDEDRKFSVKKVEDAMSVILEITLKDYKYDPSTCPNMVRDLAARIKQTVKDMGFLRYKIVSNVVIGEFKNQGVQVGSRFLWDEKLDSHATARFNNGKIFAVASCFGLYYE